MSEETKATVSLEQLDAIRKEAGRRIHPETADVYWRFVYLHDPYGDGLEIPEEYRCVGRAWFACSPGIDIWVWIDDLPKTTRDALRGKSEDDRNEDELPWEDEAEPDT